jgi:signal transduction histidine kinase
MNDKSLQLVELVNDIASLLDVELNPADIEPVDLVDVVAHSIMTQRRRAEQAGVTIETEWPDSPPIVYGSPTRLIQVFHHLLDNAIKFNCKGGRVTINLWHNGEQAYVRIADQGIGIPPAEQERIFDRFYQVDGSTTRRFGGTGLGLAIAKETIEAHKGKITVESSGIENEGAVFTIMLPLLKDNKKIRSI